MFDKIKTTPDYFSFKLQAALKMEETTLDLLEDLVEAVQSDDLREALREHAERTQQHAQNLERVFGVLGDEPETTSSPAAEALTKEGKQTLKKTADEMLDPIVASGAFENVSHEAAVYDGLIAQARALGHGDAVALLEANLADERRMRERMAAAMTAALEATARATA